MCEIGLTFLLCFCEKVPIRSLFIIGVISIPITFYSSLLVSAETNLRSYKNEILKFGLQYPGNWDIETYDRSSCLKFDTCYIIFKTNSFINMSAISIRVQNLDSVNLFACVCKTLSDYVRWNYKWNDDYNKATLIENNQTIINSNHTAWQAEISTSQINSKSLIVFAINGNLAYIFDYGVNSDKMYSEHLSDFRDMLRSIKFIPTG